VLVQSTTHMTTECNTGREPNDNELIGIAANIQLILEQAHFDVVPTVDGLDLLLDDEEGGER